MSKETKGTSFTGVLLGGLAVTCAYAFPSMAWLAPAYLWLCIVAGIICVAMLWGATYLIRTDKLTDTYNPIKMLKSLKSLQDLYFKLDAQLNAPTPWEMCKRVIVRSCLAGILFLCFMLGHTVLVGVYAVIWGLSYSSVYLLLNTLRTKVKK